MLTQRTNSYKFDHPYLKIYKLIPAYDNSIVFSALLGAGKEVIYHVGKDGKQISKVVIDDLLDTLCMPTDHHVVFLRPEHVNNVHIYDLKSKKTRTFKHESITQVSCQCYLDYFCDTNLLAVHQNGDHFDTRIHLTYYDWNIVLSQAKEGKQIQKKCEFMGTSQEWNCGYLVRKVNSHSKYIWTESRFTDQIQMRVHEIKGSDKSLYQVIKVDLKSLYQPYDMTGMEVAVVEMWQFQPSQLLLFCATDKNQKNKVNYKGVVNNTFIWNTEENQIRQSKFFHTPEYQDLQVDVIGTPMLSMFPTFMMAEKKRLKSPAIFIDNKTEKIIHQEEWITDHTQRFTLLERNAYTIVEVKQEQENINQLSVRTISLIDRREMTLYWLQTMKDKPQNEFDTEDLIEIMRMMDYEEHEIE